MKYPTSPSRGIQSTQGPDAAVKQAHQLFQTGRHEEAERVLRKVLQGSPTNADALQLMGLMAARTGKLEEAEQLLRRCVALAPKHTVAHINLGNVLVSRQQLAEAAKWYGRAVELAPDFAPAHYNQARCLRALGRLGAAIEGYRRAARLDPTFFEARVNLASALCEMEALDEAEGIYRELLTKRPDAPDIKLFLGDVLRLRGRPEEARAHYEALLRDHPNHPRGRLVLGLALLDENEVERAAELIIPVAKEGQLPRHEVLSALAALRMRQGDGEGAIQSLAEAIASGGNQPQYYLTLATWLAELRQRDRAVAVLEESLARYGDRPSGLLGQLVFNQRHLCDWRHGSERMTALLERLRRTDRSAHLALCRAVIAGTHARRSAQGQSRIRQAFPFLDAARAGATRPPARVRRAIPHWLSIGRFPRARHGLPDGFGLRTS